MTSSNLTPSSPSPYPNPHRVLTPSLPSCNILTWEYSYPQGEDQPRTSCHVLTQPSPRPYSIHTMLHLIPSESPTSPYPVPTASLLCPHPVPIESTSSPHRILAVSSPSPHRVHIQSPPNPHPILTRIPYPVLTKSSPSRCAVLDSKLVLTVRTR